MLQIIVSKWHITAGRTTYNWSLGGPHLGGSNLPPSQLTLAPPACSRAVNEPSQVVQCPNEALTRALSLLKEPSSAFI